jgi:cyclopropane fatty-acyl-phospholipid synthase-like methyltransferase
MTNILRSIGGQFRKPTGLPGKLISRLMMLGNRAAYDKMISELEIKADDRIFEIGYGHGLGVRKISSKFDCFVSGIDYSELMFNEATKRNRKYIENKKVELYLGDFLNSELISNQYDKIFCINVIYFWDLLDKPFSKILYGLKNGGAFCLYMVHSGDLEKTKYTQNAIFNKYTIDQVVDNLNLAGFSDIKYKYNKGYLIKCRKLKD